MRVTVTGGAGFIGANLCRHLLDRGHRVTVLDDLSTGYQSNVDGTGAHLTVGSVLDPDAVEATCPQADAIVHLAGLGSVPRSLRDPMASHAANATGTLAVLEAARASGAHVIVASSSSVYGTNPAMPRSEEQVCWPASPYAVSKLATESYTTAYRACFGLDTVAFRLFNVFGPLQRFDHPYPAVLPRFIQAAVREEPLTIHGDGEQSRDFTFVDTVVDVLAAAVENRTSSAIPVNLAFGTRTTVNELVGLLSQELARPLEVVHTPPRPGDVRHSQASGLLLRGLFPRIRPAAIEEAIHRTVSWLEPLVESSLTASGHPR